MAGLGEPISHAVRQILWGQVSRYIIFDLAMEIRSTSIRRKRHDF
jgi:hypothetical protein